MRVARIPTRWQRIIADGGGVTPKGAVSPFPVRGSNSTHGLKKATKVPDGQITEFGVKPSLQKYSAFGSGRNSNRANPVPRPPEGRFAIVTNVGCGMRWTR
jgi:hypothetical protein